MALIESNPFPIGTLAPNFNLLNTVTGNNFELIEGQGKKGTVVMFICNHCPFVVHVNEELVRLAKDYQTQEIGFIAISSNSVVTHPQDGPKFMNEHAKKTDYLSPICMMKHKK